jgi:hypothetical protein
MILEAFPMTSRVNSFLQTLKSKEWGCPWDKSVWNNVCVYEEAYFLTATYSATDASENMSKKKHSKALLCVTCPKLSLNRVY